jgi:hypothetical protein
VIAVEKNEPSAVAINRLVELHRKRRLSAGLTTVSAAETLAGTKEFPASAEQFRRRVEALEWHDLDIILGPAVTGFSYNGFSKIVSASFQSEVDALWGVMFPNIAQILPKATGQEELWSSTFKKWRNAWCDVHTVWTHVDAGRDVFVTLDADDILKKEGKLAELGLNRVMTPDCAIQYVLTEANKSD